jgi:hypothetical protein
VLSFHGGPDDDEGEQRSKAYYDALVGGCSFPSKDDDDARPVLFGCG